MAFKYPPEKKPPASRTSWSRWAAPGSWTPKAVLEPVRLAGTTVTNATLHNQDFIAEKDIRVGDTVLVQKAGEIIPEILEVDLTKRPEGTVPYVLPDTCPVCGAPVVRDEDGAALRCTGARVPGPSLRNLTHFEAATPWTSTAAAQPAAPAGGRGPGHARPRTCAASTPTLPAGPDGGQVRGESDPGH